jgi:hypothetical protein
MRYEITKTYRFEAAHSLPHLPADQAESCDGTGWMRGGEDRLEDLERYLRLSTRNDKRPQMVMEALL